jgi:catechol 2,3-dioxygenase-like lactoylglutathione lyase family enzyme
MNTTMERGPWTADLRAVLTAIALLAGAAAPADAQLLAAKDGPIVYGHHHVNASDIEAHKKFWTTIGGTVAVVGTNKLEVIRFPNAWLFMRTQAPKVPGGSRGTTVNHIGFSVPDLQATLDRVRANGFRIVTREEAPPTYQVKGDIAFAGPTPLAFVMGPDDVKVELLETRGQAAPAAMHHVHFFGQQNTAMRDWYAKVFGAVAAPDNPNAPFAVATLPGVRLNFSATTEPVAGTTGRSLDHIGFEVRDLAGFVKKLEAEGIKTTVSYRRIEALDTAIAFIQDPWGTLIELSDGLARLP